MQRSNFKCNNICIFDLVLRTLRFTSGPRCADCTCDIIAQWPQQRTRRSRRIRYGEVCSESNPGETVELFFRFIRISPTFRFRLFSFHPNRMWLCRVTSDRLFYSLTRVSKVEAELIGVQGFKAGIYAIPLVLVSAVKRCMVGYSAHTNTTRHQVHIRPLTAWP